MKLRFPESEIPQWASNYEPQGTIAELESKLIELRPTVQEQGYLDKELLKDVAYWKSPRIIHHIERNDNNDVKEITSRAFSATDEGDRIEPLLLLNGVWWPTASVILHFFHRDPYPILDFRAMWSIGLKNYTYSLPFWQEYFSFCRDIAHRNQVDMRTLDKALWQYSKENQPPS